MQIVQLVWFRRRWDILMWLLLQNIYTPSPMNLAVCFWIKGDRTSSPSHLIFRLPSPKNSRQIAL
ncbi:MAG TPA: hypothetical protein V6D15_11495 [Oculatellaceae cyanobacterium]